MKIFRKLDKRLLKVIYTEIIEFEKNENHLGNNLIGFLNSNIIKSQNLKINHHKILYLKTELFKEISRRYFNN